MKEIALLKEGKIGILATDTIYGIVASAFSKKAVEKIYKTKGRDENKPFIILISSINDLKKFGFSLSPTQKTFLKTTWPGPVSVIVPCTSTGVQRKLKYLHRGTNSFAFRMPKKKSLLALLQKTGPLVAPSANPQGKEPAKTIIEAEKYFEKKVDFYIDEGRKDGKSSKLLKIETDGSIVVLRK